ncbi:hypothetical protein F5888DRAFT_415711 [Russula emetica]|nr:hypothetical protein F5888DRAFT_415711 [Russula emetica]
MVDMIVEIMVEVLTILAIATKTLKSGRSKRWLKKLMGNSDIEDSLKKLDKLTQEEARMAHAELLKVTHSIDEKVTNVDKRVKGVDETAKSIEGEVRNARSDLQDVGGKIEGVEEIAQAVQADVKHVVSSMRIAGTDTKDISSKVRDVGDKVDQVNRNQLRESLMRWLSAPDSSINHNIARKAHHGGTAQWFLQGGIFNQWKSSGSLLWVHGKPGSGKTVLCSSIIEDINALHDAGSALMAYFYFDFRDVDKQNLRNLLQSLLVQLSAQSDPCCAILSKLYSKHNRGVRKPSDRDMVECLKEMLCLEKQAPTYIIMDALDECPITSTIPSPREEVLEFVDELTGLQLPNLHICVTSQPEHDIQVVLKRLTVCPVSLHDESGQQKDIANYIASFVRSDKGMPRLGEEDKNLVIKTLSEKADGM